ncbi:hypothetical protein, partial [Chromobacterium haemolyticum]|uniref:hypothetical protein n=1 Tax=Chromobacterium haemolyticum TaxID=394935 RepID=UPI001930B266
MKKIFDAFRDLFRSLSRSEMMWFLVAIAFVFIVWMYFSFFGSNWIAERLTGENLNKLSASEAAALRGQSGDAFGSFGALFSALSSVLFALSFYFQFKKDNRQKFENNFFQLLAGHREIV